MSKKEKQQIVIQQKTNGIILIILIILLIIFVFFFTGCLALFYGSGSKENIKGNTAIIPIYGEIAVGDSVNFFNSISANSERIISLIEKAEADKKIKAVIFEINSPGGSAVASMEISARIKKLNKTKVCVIREVGASGAYWVASSCEYIIASPLSITGSIGVIGSYLDFSGLMKRYNITYQRLVSGEYKDTGSPFKNLTENERKIIQKKLDTIHDYFIEEVGRNRNIQKEKIREIANGMIYLGVEAKDLGLIDELGGLDEATSYIEQKLNITVKTTRYISKPSFIEVIMGLSERFSFNVGKGIVSGIKENNMIIT